MSASAPTPIAVVCALIERDGHVLMAQRPAHKHLGGKWEFPGGKVEPGETPEAALHRELQEELGCTVEILRPLAPHTHEHAALRWVPAGELTSLDLPEADLPIIADYLRT